MMCLMISPQHVVIGRSVMEEEAIDGGSDLREVAHTNLENVRDGNIIKIF
jgi:hypothetical protein